MAIRTRVPLARKILSTSSPDAVRMGWVSCRVSSTLTCEMEDEERIHKVVQVTNTHLPRQVGYTGVSPQYLTCERVEVGKGVHELAVFFFAECAAKFSTKGFLYVVVTGEFNKGPLCVTSTEALE